ncbi:MAG TPA: hypothetical protein PKC39_08905 [Ferruginibacter sp.]|nr:hypothetical protein [Ferruginibacter sp.]HMP21064.1 hypothetical protein [Ferruginibacter sp.]
MMKAYQYVLIASLSLFVLYELVFSMVGQRAVWMMMGADGYLFALCYAIAGLLALLFKKTRMAGTALLTSAGILCLVGYSICSSMRFPH